MLPLAASYAVLGTPFTIRAAEWFIGFSMCVLALLKTQNLESFSGMFWNYDLLAKRRVSYSYVFRFAEGGAGVQMIAGALTWLSVPVLLFNGSIGAVSVFKAVYLDKRELRCACVRRGQQRVVGLHLAHPKRDDGCYGGVDAGHADGGCDGLVRIEAMGAGYA